MSVVKHLVIYHGGGCLDGLGAAAAFYRYFGDSAEYIEGVYQSQQEIDFAGRRVYLLDFSYPPDDLLKILSVAEMVVSLDHHENAIAAVKDIDHPRFFNHNFVERSGVALAWDYLFTGSVCPMILQHIEDRDLWKFKLEHTKEVTTALYAREDVTIQNLLDFDIDDLMVEGATLLRAHNKECKETIKNNLRWITIGGGRDCPVVVTVPVVNASPKLSSDVGHMLAKSFHGIGATYIDTETTRNFSLRGNGSIDVSEIARVFGGNGHRNAAGFKVPRSHYLATV
jgi:oligoribonuclease NrnB/cAMP/cGMP phosphodiesterase (DHH superfamily)